ncbi:uncharacterized protein PFL1_01824 [Pseudozyma flocculosa PF-1]|uniref:Related to TMT1 - trans-aconitate methyltransferase n=1 Tax=Pseudozyma flocculosa TaxID=84751 RepID=A0A5C3EWT9_9BASI|nr:uncharacterized protein PFL1_01824 [Pseudozyma flocculosa PF-1]EPQ30926.1 hypothetical protein PFL1_01824 [Pseudozyma flocculosa PF-1]SPO36688.1 related to TMT1 - trans-aconitate methyltransferase [Pseudozyma flocculosa]
MATFSKTTFDAASYLAFRPSYPRWTYTKLLAYHFGRLPSASSPPPSPPPAPSAGSSPTVALDLGCGPGISTLALLPHFDRVIGLDPSKKMVDAAIRPESSSIPAELRSDANEGGRGRLGTLEYRQGTAEELDFLPEQSVDLIAAGQAAHWFKYDRLWPALSRVLKPGGSVCFWGYPDMYLPDYPSTRPAVLEWAVGPSSSPGDGSGTTAAESIGPYWEQPGRSIISNCFADIPFPTAPEWDQATAIRRVFSTEGLLPEQIPARWPPQASPGSPRPDTASLSAEARAELETPGNLEKSMTWEMMSSYLHTWSSVHNFLEEHPGDRDDPRGDVVERFLRRLRDEIGRGERGGRIPERVTLRWPVGFLFVKKAAAA